jgi:hypothetical protein
VVKVLYVADLMCWIKVSGADPSETLLLVMTRAGDGGVWSVVSSLKASLR